GLRKLAAKISYIIDPDNPYPANFTGHIRAVLKNGSVREVHRSHMRGGAHEPLTAAEIAAKFHDNARFGGWSEQRAGRLAEALEAIVHGNSVNLAIARGA
ncbi:MAG: MmgE/PrpD family protein, partial [Alphaproteobacteria bacterium]|nr:MmgE/PrpD family protein [Alphaproteobacteria bacterium]